MILTGTCEVIPKGMWPGMETVSKGIFTILISPSRLLRARFGFSKGIGPTIAPK